jgi:hypothetical protein
LNDHATGFSKLLETLSQDHSCTGDCAVCNHYLSQADPDPKLRSNVVGQLLVVVGVLDLENQRCTNGIRSTREFGNEGIPSDLVRDPAVVFGCLREPLESRPNTRVGKGFILLNQRRRAHNIGVENDSELS